jgi:hypothetical protein
VPVIDDQLRALHAYLSGDFATYGKLRDQLSEMPDQSAWGALIGAGFFEAVDRRFAKGGTVSDSAAIVEYVADVRARSYKLAQDIDPAVAERLIQDSLGHGSADDIDARTRLGMRFLLLAALIVDEQLDEEGLEAFLAQAREVADQWLA